MRIRLRVRGGEAKAALERKRDAVRRALLAFRDEGGQFVRGVMVAVIRERQRGGTGATSNSVLAVPTPRGFWVGSTLATAVFVDRPTRPHLIRPRNAKALAFPGRVGLAPGFTKTRGGKTRSGRSTAFRDVGGRQVASPVAIVRVVHHPGTRGLDFTGETLRRVPEGLARILRERVARELEAG